MKRFLLAASLSLFALSGCGGGGGSTNVFGGQIVHTYVTDSFRDDFDHVWVKIYKVILNGPTPAVLFDEPAGRVIDLKTLRDANGVRYAFLDTATAEAAVYSELAVTVDRNVNIVPAGGQAAQEKQFSALHDDGNRSTLRFSMLGFSLVAAATFAVDFDLAAWVIEGSGKVRAQIKLGNNTGIASQLRHEEDDVRGSISELVGASPDQTFVLKRNGRQDLMVRTSNKTRIFNESGAQSPSLSNTSGVELSGIFVGGNFFASSIKIEDLGGNNLAELEGLPQNPNEAAGTFNVVVARANNVVPDATRYSVSTTASTRYLSDTGATITKAQFFQLFTDLGPTSSVEVEGNASANGQMEAARVKIDTDSAQNQVHVRGTLETEGADSFTVSSEQWQGFNLRIGDTITADLGGSTVYVLDGQVVSKAAFFAVVNVNDEVEVRGLLNGTTITALRVIK